MVFQNASEMQYVPAFSSCLDQSSTNFLLKKPEKY